MIPDAHTNTSHLIITSFVAEHFYFVVVTVTPCLTVIPRLVMNSPFGGRITDVLIWPHLRCNSPEVPEQPCGKSIKRETFTALSGHKLPISQKTSSHTSTPRTFWSFSTLSWCFLQLSAYMHAPPRPLDGSRRTLTMQNSLWSSYEIIALKQATLCFWLYNALQCLAPGLQNEPKGCMRKTRRAASNSELIIGRNKSIICAKTLL